MSSMRWLSVQISHSADYYLHHCRGQGRSSFLLVVTTPLSVCLGAALLGWILYSTWLFSLEATTTCYATRRSG
jgi:hypothetical protein